MPSFAIIFAVVVAAGALTASAVPVAPRAQPSGWATGYLEKYETYHLRYLALDCQHQHNTTFFETCCHPLLASESLSSRPAECTPSSTQNSSASLEAETASATATDDESVYCDEATSVAAAVSSIVATATASVSAVVLTSTVSASGTASASAVVQTLAVQNNLVGSASSSSSHAHQWRSSSSPSAAWTPTSTSSTWTPAATTATSSGGSGTTYTGGFATFFYQDGVAGECGTVYADTDYVIAIDAAGWWPDYMTDSTSPYCGKSIVITNTNNGKTVTAVVADVCPTCDTNNSLDLSLGAFEALADLSDGMVPITWQFA